MRATAILVVIFAVAVEQEVRADRATFRSASNRLRRRKAEAAAGARPSPPRVVNLPRGGGRHPFGGAAPPPSLVAPVEKDERRIIQGQMAAPCQFPHQVALRTHMDYSTGFCGGSLITPRWVLTAAHCVEKVYRGVDVRGGSNDMTRGVARKAKRIFFHEDYDTWNLWNDVALIELDEEVPISECFRPVTLEETGCDSDELDNIATVVSGWGYTEAGSPPRNLMWTRATTITNAECIEAYNADTVERGTLCTKPSDPNHNGTICQGDSGGPLLRADTGTQVGINSFTGGVSCSANFPSGYARVPCFIDWINRVMSL